MATLVEMATEMVITRAKTTPMTPDEMLADLQKFHSALQRLENGTAGAEAALTDEPAQPETPKISLKEAFKKNEVVCMVCGKGGFKTLARHLTTSHGMKPREYRKQFGIPASQPLSAKVYSEARRQMANDRGLADNLAKAREVRMAKVQAKAQAGKPGQAAAKGAKGGAKKQQKAA